MLCAHLDVTVANPSELIITSEDIQYNSTSSGVVQQFLKPNLDLVSGNKGEKKRMIYFCTQKILFNHLFASSKSSTNDPGRLLSD